MKLRSSPRRQLQWLSHFATTAEGDKLLIVHLDRYLSQQTVPVSPAVFDGKDTQPGFSVAEWLESHGVMFPTWDNGERATVHYDAGKQLLHITNTVENIDKARKLILQFRRQP